VLLVDADQAEARHRSEHRRPRPDDDAGLARDDPLALVAPLGVGEARVEDGDPVPEARLEAAQRLRRQRDLGHEHDRPPPALERGGARLEVHLGLPAAGRAGEQEVGAVAVERLDEAADRSLLRLGQPRRLGLAGHPGGRATPLPPPRAQLRRDELERARGRRAVVVGDPEREVDERGGQLVEDVPDRRGRDARRRLHPDLDDDAAPRRAAEADRDDGALPHALGHLVRERARHRPRGHERVDGRERHAATLASGPEPLGPRSARSLL
jgi:hypothetical protein